MNLKNVRFLVIMLAILTISSFLFSMHKDSTIGNRKFDTSGVHNIGNIWLRVSNYGFFGSGETDPKWPSLEYPGGSSIDYLYLGGLWFGAKKVKRDHLGRKYFWLHFPPVADNDYVLESDSLWNDTLPVVVDTLVSIGCDGWHRINELLPAYNPLETSHLGAQYTAHNYQDKIISASIREQRKGVDDDNDNLIDEDPVGYAFPFRAGDELPAVFSVYGGDWLHNSQGPYGTDIITDEDNQSIWYPLGFLDLSDDSNDLYNFSETKDDDGDGIADEDGYPVSEQDFISYYYDYSPFPNGNPDPDRDYSSSAGSNTHVPLNIRVRQMSYQWSYEYIKNLCYVEFNITNMNIEYGDTLFDCAMGIYMDSDVGPQSFGASAIAPDDLSSYVSGEGYEFAYTYDADTDGGLTTGFVGSRVCTPDPEQLVFACWTWDVGWGPDDWNPLAYFSTTANDTPNEKYWLLTGRNPDDEFCFDVKADPNYQPDHFPGGTDTRYLFAFYGDMLGMTNPTAGSWNLAPGKTMKIVIAVFPGETIPELMQTAGFAKFIYGEAQTLTTVVEPDTFPHYQAPEPPDYPQMYANLIDNGNAIGVYWDNKSEFTIDIDFVPQRGVGWQEIYENIDSHIDKYDDQLALYGYFPIEYAPYDSLGNPQNRNENAIINPWTAFRLRHDFQGYTLYGRSGSGSQEDWVEKGKWDKYETDQDLIDYEVNHGDTFYVDYKGDIGIGTYNKSLPNRRQIIEDDLDYYHYNEHYELIPFDIADDYVFGEPLYDYTKTRATALAVEGLENWSDNDKALYFINPNLQALPLGEDVYLELYSRGLIPLDGFVSSVVLEEPEKIEEIRQKRLSRRYYHRIINYPPKGIEYYIAVTTWDRGYPSQWIRSLESGRDADANMKIIFPGPSAKTNMNNIYVVPNPYVGQSAFDGRREDDFTGDRSRRLWFVNLPEDCTIKIYTLAGDLVDKVVHHGTEGEDIITVGAALNKDKLKKSDITASGMASWDLLSKNNQIIAAGVYLFSVKDHKTGDNKVGKFVIIK
ncbi:MAG: hypothetical protein ISS80_00035 [Candidatus Cloacimonetes bacterium]|nr:hypothetical protein [Candidatus Cloacimonadota bacterium]MBL7148446.1 hypothetical protein [Candidatus Cloacimonadota bacterium]